MKIVTACQRNSSWDFITNMIMCKYHYAIALVLINYSFIQRLARLRLQHLFVFIALSMPFVLYNIYHEQSFHFSQASFLTDVVQYCQFSLVKTWVSFETDRIFSTDLCSITRRNNSLAASKCSSSSDVFIWRLLVHGKWRDTCSRKKLRLEFLLKQ
jgi:hypothetical protein